MIFTGLEYIFKIFSKIFNFSLYKLGFDIYYIFLICCIYCIFLYLFRLLHLLPKFFDGAKINICIVYDIFQYNSEYICIYIGCILKKKKEINSIYNFIILNFN